MAPARLEPDATSRIIDLGTSIITECDGFLRLTVRPGTHYVLEHSTEVVKVFAELSGGRATPIVVTAFGYASADAASRRYLSGPEAKKAVLAMAIVVHSSVMRVIATFVVRIAGPEFPCRVFTDDDEAIQWARSHAQR